MSTTPEEMWGPTCALCPPDVDPHPFSVHLNTAEQKRARFTEPVVQRVVDLWNRQGGWIPGVAYKELAEVLGIDTDRLIHWDHENRVRHSPDTEQGGEGMGPGSGPLRTQEEKVAFRKDFDRRVEEGQS